MMPPMMTGNPEQDRIAMEQFRAAEASFNNYNKRFREPPLEQPPPSSLPNPPQIMDGGQPLENPPTTAFPAELLQSAQVFPQQTAPQPVTPQQTAPQPYIPTPVQQGLPSPNGIMSQFEEPFSINDMQQVNAYDNFSNNSYNSPQGVQQMLQPLIRQAMQQSQQETSEKIPAYLQQVSELTNSTFPNLYSNGIGSIPNQITGSLQYYQNPSMMRGIEIERQKYGAFGV